MSQSKPLHFRLCLASPGGFEPLTPRLGGECSIQLSYEDMSDFWLKIRAFWHFLSFRIGSRLFNYLCFLDELLHPTFLDTFAFGGKLYNTYFDRFELSSSFLRRRVLYPAELRRHMLFSAHILYHKFLFLRRPFPVDFFTIFFTISF